jgi:hypothetical protein
VISKGGSVQFYYNPLDKGNLIDNSIQGNMDRPQYMASFLTAIVQFAKEMHNDEISNFEMNKSRVILATGTAYDVYYVIISDKKDKKGIKELESQLQHIRELFESKFTADQVNSCKGDISHFNSFCEVLEKNSNKNIEDFFNNF